MTMLLGDVFKNSTFKLFMLLLSAGLLIIGMVGLLFSIFLYPTLVPYYGGGERFLILDNSVEYPLYSKSKLCFEVSSNATVIIAVDSEDVEEGLEVSYCVDAGEHLLRIRSNEPAEGFINFRQEPPRIWLLFYLLLLIIGSADLSETMKRRSG